MPLTDSPTIFLLFVFCRLFTEYAYSKKQNIGARHFMVTSFADCSSMVVDEDTLKQMRTAG